MLPSSNASLSATGTFAISGQHSLTAHPLACLRIAWPVTGAQAQGWLPTCLAVALIGRDLHPLDGSSAFRGFPHLPSPRTSLAWSHGDFGALAFNRTLALSTPEQLSGGEKRSRAASYPTSRSGPPSLRSGCGSRRVHLPLTLPLGRGFPCLGLAPSSASPDAPAVPRGSNPCCAPPQAYNLLSGTPSLPTSRLVPTPSCPGACCSYQTSSPPDAKRECTTRATLQRAATCSKGGGDASRRPRRSCNRCGSSVLVFFEGANRLCTALTERNIERSDSEDYGTRWLKIGRAATSAVLRSLHAECAEDPDWGPTHRSAGQSTTPARKLGAARQGCGAAGLRRTRRRPTGWMRGPGGLRRRSA